MHYNKILDSFSIFVFVVIISSLIFISSAYATNSTFVITIFPPVINQNNTTAGPVIPSTPSTIVRYCSSGICLVNNTNPFLNATKGFFAFGNYSNGIYLSHSTLYGIQLSDTCIHLEISHTPSNCLTYDQLKFLDTTNPNYAGKWVNDTWYHRSSPSIKQTWNFETGKPVVMVDPDPDFTAKAKMIIVSSHPFTFMNPDLNITNHIATQFHDRFVPSDCASAIVAPNVWLVNDTLHYLESACKITKFNGTSFEITPYNPLRYDTITVAGVNWISHFNNVTRTGNCIWEKCNVPTDPFHNHDKKFAW